MLVRQQHGLPAEIRRISAFIFGVTYIAFDTAAGVVTAILVSAAR